MGLYRFKPLPSGRMGIYWTLSALRDSAIVEFGCMGHNLYGSSAQRRAGIYEGYGAVVYTTYIDETDISLGETSRLDATIRHVVQAYNPKVVFLLPSAVPEVVGIDLNAVVKIMQPDFPGTPLIPVGHGSFAISQHQGVREALTTLATRLPKDPHSAAISDNRDAPAYNIIGSCPDLLRYGADAAEIARVMKGAFDMEPICVLSSGASVSDIEKMGCAKVNLVIRREGIPAAEALRDRFGAPFIAGRPYGIDGTAGWLRDVGRALGRTPDEQFILAERDLALAQIDQAYDYLEGNEWSYPEEAVLSIGGHADVVGGILKFATTEIPLHKGACWCDCPEMAGAEIPYLAEKDWIPIVRNHDKGYLMFSGEALRWAGKNTQLAISNPDAEWRIHPYEPPFVGFRGAVHLVNLWVNEYTLTH